MQAKAKAESATTALYTAVGKNDLKGAQAAIKDFLAVANIKTGYEGKTKDYTQGYSSEYDWKYATPKGTIYVR